ncbi:glycosyltransferase family 2 protein [Coraliomargarita sp. W4R53]
MKVKTVYSLGVVIPTRNSMPEIQDHIQALNKWIDQVQEVIVIDSHSVDGTADYIRSNLRHPAITFLDHPPGLYESWNSAIEHVQAKYTYIATVGDHMPFETLERLYHYAESLTADVVLSAPKITTPTGKRIPGNWPIHSLIKKSKCAPVYSLPALERFIWNVSFLPKTLLGSSASNLYKTSILKAAPFPTDYGHAGDSAWAISRPLSDRWIVVTDAHSHFVKDSTAATRRQRAKLSRPKLYQLACDTFEGPLNGFSHLTKDLDAPIQVRELLRLFLIKGNDDCQYDKIRQDRIPWYLTPRGWYLRTQKKRICSKIEKLSASLRQSVTDKDESESAST